MKPVTKYVCEKCRKEYLTSNEAEKCENSHICICREARNSNYKTVSKTHKINSNQAMSIHYDYEQRKLYFQLSTSLYNRKVSFDHMEINMNYCPECGDKI